MARGSLRGKWLTDMDSDFNKALKIYQSEVAKKIVSGATLILTSSHEPSEDLVRDLHAAAINGLEIDIWSASRIADFLDLDAEGRWIRHAEFGVPQERLSLSLLSDLCLKTWQNNLANINHDALIARQFDSALEDFHKSLRGTGFIIGDSGTGKSVACVRLAKNAIAHGQFILLMPHRILEESSTLSQALSKLLIQKSTNLANDCGSAALKIAADHSSITVVVEDINRSYKPTALLNKLAGWNTKGFIPSQESNAQKWRILCPLWRKTLNLSETNIRRKIEETAIEVGLFDRKESICAVEKYSSRAGVSLSQVELNESAEALGDDPLLIGFNTDWKTPSSFE